MGKLNLGILGGFSGAVGTVVGSTNRKGEDIIRARSKKARPASSAGQVQQQAKFGMVTGFIQGLTDVVKTGLKNSASAENIAVIGCGVINHACTMAIAEGMGRINKVYLYDINRYKIHTVILTEIRILQDADHIKEGK